MREADCSTYKFRTLTTELARLMAYEASRDFEIEKYIIDGWCGQIEGDRIKGKTLTVVPIFACRFGYARRRARPDSDCQNQRGRIAARRRNAQTRFLF